MHKIIIIDHPRLDLSKNFPYMSIMKFTNYNNICDHQRLTRLNDNFVRCLDCGESMVNQKIIQTNKGRREFTTENPSINKNFNRNFNNSMEEVDHTSNQPLLEFYTDRLGVNLVVIDRADRFFSDPVKYKVRINSEVVYLIQEQIAKLLSDISAIRIDSTQAFKMTPSFQS